MKWLAEWSAIEGQIREVNRMCESYISTLIGKNNDVYGSSGLIFKFCSTLIVRIGIYQTRYQKILPSAAISAIDDVLNDFKPHFKVNSGDSSPLTPSAFLFYKERFNIFAFDFNYHTKERDGDIYRRSEKAFIHLQRTLAVSEEDSNRWKNAFEKHETHIEALGSVHLLSHGIWAFKVDDGGQRTDLVFKEHYTSETISNIRVASEGLVLTEWKLVKNPKDALKKATEAFNQTKIYSSESLEDLELTTYRYLVLVSLKKLSNLPANIVDGMITYRVINIAIEIESPSIRSRRKT